MKKDYDIGAENRYLQLAKELSYHRFNILNAIFYRWFVLGISLFKMDKIVKAPTIFKDYK